MSVANHSSEPCIVYCPVCQVDTIPLPEGDCGFCRTVLLERVGDEWRIKPEGGGGSSTPRPPTEP